MRPIANARDQAVFHWIDVTILNVAGIVRLIPDEVFPKSSLPDTALPTRPTCAAHALLLRQRLCKARLDQPPAQGKIGVARRQRPNRMEMDAAA